MTITTINWIKNAMQVNKKINYDLILYLNWIQITVKKKSKMLDEWRPTKRLKPYSKTKTVSRLTWL